MGCVEGEGEGKNDGEEPQVKDASRPFGSTGGITHPHPIDSC